MGYDKHTQSHRHAHHAHTHTLPHTPPPEGRPTRRRVLLFLQVLSLSSKKISIYLVVSKTVRVLGVTVFAIGIISGQIRGTPKPKKGGKVISPK